MQHIKKDLVLFSVEETTLTVSSQSPRFTRKRQHWPLYKMATCWKEDNTMALIAMVLFVGILCLVVWHPWHSGMIILP